jgi:hypothetical protein
LLDLCPDYPAELVRYAADEAGRDADDVVAFLTAAGLAPPPGEARGFPPGILVDLGAVVRLRRWEEAGYSVHTESGLPTAQAALNHVIETLSEAVASRAALAVAGVLGRAAPRTHSAHHATNPLGPPLPPLGRPIMHGVARVEEPAPSGRSHFLDGGPSRRREPNRATGCGEK